MKVEPVPREGLTTWRVAVAEYGTKNCNGAASDVCGNNGGELHAAILPHDLIHSMDLQLSPSTMSTRVGLMTRRAAQETSRVGLMTWRAAQETSMIAYFLMVSRVSLMTWRAAHKTSDDMQLPAWRNNQSKPITACFVLSLLYSAMAVTELKIKWNK